MQPPLTFINILIFSRYVCLPRLIRNHLNMSSLHCHSLNNLQIQVVSSKLKQDLHENSEAIFTILFAFEDLTRTLHTFKQHLFI